MSIKPQTPDPVPATLLGSCADCKVEITERLQLALESIRVAAKRPITPELLILCKECRRQLVVRLHPVPESTR